ncbi:hypothetical protein [Bacillus sp. BP-3]|uniref:hypothetical protein n=1 Tax=Bacillus sp. BP-3 TaxID=3022773 RepID=UPI00232BDA9C|nr:hypothetical protein [Bacillus sp. BP-3]MDC2863774.1 hypothetical protein [Bacillus sp. BP-3]
MKLVEQLKSKQENTIDSKVLEFADEIKELITSSAEKGYSAYRYVINNETKDRHMLYSDMFIEKLKILMDGVHVELKKDEKKNILGGIYYENYIYFNWNY